MMVYRRIYPKTRNTSDRICIENEITDFMSYIFFFENCAVYKIMWKNTVEPERPQ
jgi:hypothetical protein